MALCPQCHASLADEAAGCPFCGFGLNQAWPPETPEAGGFMPPPPPPMFAPLPAPPPSPPTRKKGFLGLIILFVALDMIYRDSHLIACATYGIGCKETIWQNVLHQLGMGGS